MSDLVPPALSDLTDRHSQDGGQARTTPGSEQTTPLLSADSDDDGRRWMKRFLSGEYDRWLVVKRRLNVQEDHVIAKVLLDFFQAHGGLDSKSRILPGDDVTSQGSRIEAVSPPARQKPRCMIKFADEKSNLQGDEKCDAKHTSEPRRQDGAGPCPQTTEPAEDQRTVSGETTGPAGGERTVSGEATGPAGGNRTPSGERRRTESAEKRRRLPAVAAESAEPDSRPGGRAAAALPAVPAPLMALLSCGLCGAGDAGDLGEHLAHLWSAHTELRGLASPQLRRVPLKLRPHMFVLCALCGLNNRSTSTSGAAGRHLSKAHLPARHAAELRAAAAGPLSFSCDGCAASCASRAELALHALDAGHYCAAFVCRECGAEGEGRANAAHHRLWHRAARPFQCYLCAERFEAEPDCVAHVRGEHAAAYNVHRCRQCRYAASTVCQFVQHARTHAGLTTRVCHRCGVTFRTAQSLRRHLATHEAAAGFRCDQCGAQFRHPLPLQRHVTSRHLRPEDHRCSACGKLFSSRYHLARHALIHAGRRPHQCERCGRGFAQRGDLGRHARRCRADTADLAKAG